MPKWMIVKRGTILGYSDNYRQALESAKAIGATVVAVDELPIKIKGKIQRIVASHDWVWVKINGEWYEATPIHDALYEPKEWVKEVLTIQEMNVKDFMEKYAPHELSRDYWSSAEKHSVARYTEEELKEKAGMLKLTH